MYTNLDGGKGRVYGVGELVLGHVISYMLRRVEFRTARRQEDAMDVDRQHERFGLVPSGTVHDHEDAVFGKPAGDLRHEVGHVHRVGFSVDGEHNRAVVGRHSCVGVGPFTIDQLGHHRAGTGRRPTFPQGTDAAEASFIHEH